MITRDVGFSGFESIHSGFRDDSGFSFRVSFFGFRISGSFSGSECLVPRHTMVESDTHCSEMHSEPEMSAPYVPFVLQHLVVGGRCKATWKREFKFPWREAGPPNHLDDQVDSDQ